MTERDQLLAAIRADPHEDTPRLVLADWLEENGGDLDRAHAELIRLQIALVSHPAHHTAETGCPHRKRERELLAIVEPVVRRGARCGDRCWNGKPSATDERCPFCDGGGYTGVLAQIQAPRQLSAQNWEWVIRCDFARGFPWRVYCTLAEYRREVGRRPCPEVRDPRLDLSGDLTRYRTHANCLTCAGKGTVPVTWAEQLLREHGTVTEIVLTDRRPERDAAALVDGYSYDWLNGDELYRNDAATLPGYLFGAVRLYNSSHNPIRYNFAEWPTEAAALAALSRAAADHARVSVGLPRVWSKEG